MPGQNHRLDHDHFLPIIRYYQLAIQMSLAWLLKKWSINKNKSTPKQGLPQAVKNVPDQVQKYGSNTDKNPPQMTWCLYLCGGFLFSEA
jgi:hypothetical protein